ncbi:MAG: hypothetical protein WCW64_00735 [Phycisphaerae bacterium]|jgi:hypothetical protein
MEPPNQKKYSNLDKLTLITKGKKINVNLEFGKNGTIIKFAKKELTLTKNDTYQGLPIQYHDWFYKKVEDMVEGKIIGCINCKFFKVLGFLYEQSHGWGGVCTFLGDNQNKRVTYEPEEPKEAFFRKIKKNYEIKITGILDYCTEYKNEE